MPWRYGWTYNVLSGDQMERLNDPGGWDMLVNAGNDGWEVCGTVPLPPLPDGNIRVLLYLKKPQ